MRDVSVGVISFTICLQLEINKNFDMQKNKHQNIDIRFETRFVRMSLNPGLKLLKWELCYSIVSFTETNARIHFRQQLININVSYSPMEITLSNIG